MDIVTHRPDESRPGTFMLLVTPGSVLAPIANGADYTLVLDVSGSMDTKLATLQDAVAVFLRTLAPADRFRIVKFSTKRASVPRPRPRPRSPCCSQSRSTNTSTDTLRSSR